MDKWLTIDEIADELRVDRRVIIEAIRDGKLKAARVGRQWRIKRSDLERYLEGGDKDEDTATP